MLNAQCFFQYVLRLDIRSFINTHKHEFGRPNILIKTKTKAQIKTTTHRQYNLTQKTVNESYKVPFLCFSEAKTYFRYTPLLTASRSKFVHHTFCTSRIYKNAVNHFVSLAYEKLFTLLLKQWCNCQCSADTNI